MSVSERTSGSASQQMANLSQPQLFQPSQPMAAQTLSQPPPSGASGHMTKPRVSYAQSRLGQADTALTMHHGHNVSSYAMTQNNGTKSAAKMHQDPGHWSDNVRQLNTYLNSLKSNLRSSYNQMASNKDSRNPSKQFMENKANLEYFTTRIMSVTSATLELQETLSSLQDQMQET